MSSARVDLLEAIDRLAGAAHVGNHAKIERRRQEARALVSVLIPPPTHLVDCDRCGVRCGTRERLAEHVHHVHDGPEPEHWQR